MKQLQKLVSVFPENKRVASLSLFIEAGAEGFSAVWHAPGRPIRPEGVFSGFFPADATIEQKLEALEAILDHESFSGNFKSVHISYDVKKALLVPDVFSGPDLQTPMLDLCFGESDDEEEKSEKIEGKEMSITYRIPIWLHQSLVRRFSSASFTHSGRLKAIAGNSSANSLIDCRFSPGMLRVMVYSGNKLIMMQQFRYTVPADVSYFLLRICKEAGLLSDEVKIISHGMIERDSNLFREICKYFLQAELGHGSDETMVEALKACPSHYYSHLIPIASCVS